MCDVCAGQVSVLNRVTVTVVFTDAVIASQGRVTVFLAS